ncbi:MAG TPA: c-type cytochrome [Gemmatimonadaceae bacterium]|nr:c-type cytochrome [Gemmatimonadaceae bacterium]
MLSYGGWMRRRTRWTLGTVGLAVLACSGGDQSSANDTTAAAPGGTGATTGAATTPSAATGPFTEASITPQMIALGDSIFKGQAAGGICYTCHGPDGKGTQLAPDLSDDQWINGDGSLDFIVQTIRNGVPQPKQHPGPMPGFGQSLSEEQIRAVASYEYSLSHPDVGRAGT